MIEKIVESPHLLPVPSGHRAGCLHCPFEIEVPKDTMSFGVEHTCGRDGRAFQVVWPSSTIERPALGGVA